MKLGRAWPILALAMLCGCQQLPLNGPAGYDIPGGGSTGLSNPPHTQVYDYAFVDINPVVLEYLVQGENDLLAKAFGGPAASLRVGVGDVLEATVFESSSGGLFTPAGAGNRAGNFVTVPRQTVSTSGDITVPYAGVVHVAGETVPDIERQIEGSLVKRAIEPQVIVTMVEQNAGTVSVVGDAVSSSNKLKLSGSERILDLVSKAGGLKFPPYNSVVMLQRGKKSAAVRFTTLVAHPEENVYVHPSDLVYVYRDQRKYVAAGAVGATSGGASVAGNQTLVGAVGLFSFDQEDLSLNEALAKAGGLIDYRADPAQVFVYRIEHRNVLERMGVDLSGFAPSQKMIPTVYRANFRDPSAFLYSQRFPMRDKDTIYVANAEFIEVGKAFAYLRDWTSTTAGVAADANVVRWHGP